MPFNSRTSCLVGEESYWPGIRAWKGGWRPQSERVCRLVTWELWESVPKRAQRGRSVGFREIRGHVAMWPGDSCNCRWHKSLDHSSNLGKWPGGGQVTRDSAKYKIDSGNFSRQLMNLPRFFTSSMESPGAQKDASAGRATIIWQTGNVTRMPAFFRLFRSKVTLPTLAKLAISLRVFSD
jgi:hypothetical protein